jgi:hypothetical protein
MQIEDPKNLISFPVAPRNAMTQEGSAAQAPGKIIDFREAKLALEQAESVKGGVRSAWPIRPRDNDDLLQALIALGLYLLVAFLVVVALLLK